jgi:catechol 2,3-dioxygenase-like lactoylglutathione lyase family enzyme
MLDCLDHVIFTAKDLDAASRDLARLLGRDPSWRGFHPDLGTANALFRLENCYVEILAASGDGIRSRLLRAWIAEKGEGLLGLAFGAADIDACRQRLADSGLEPGPVDGGHGRDSRSGAQRQWRRIAIPPHRTRGVLLFPIAHDPSSDELPTMPPRGDERACIHGVDHIVVQTVQPEEARRLYGDALGIRLAVDREFPQWGVRLMFFRIGGVTVEVAAALGGGAAASVFPGASAGPGEDRLYGLTWRVRDIEATHARLEREGFEVSEVRTGRRPDTRVFTVRSGTLGVPTLMIELPESKQ